MIPVRAAVVRLVDAAVGSEQQTLGRARIDRERVAVGMDVLEAVLAPGLPAVLGDVEDEAEHVDLLVVLRIDADLAEIERARVEVALALPRIAAVVAPEHPPRFARDVVDIRGPARGALDDGIDDVRILREDREPDAPRRGWKAARQLFPRGAAVGRAEDAAEILASCRVGSGDERPRRSAPRVEDGVHRLGIGWIDRDVAAAGLVLVGLGLQDRLPRL